MVWPVIEYDRAFSGVRDNARDFAPDQLFPERRNPLYKNLMVLTWLHLPCAQVRRVRYCQDRFQVV